MEEAYITTSVTTPLELHSSAMEYWFQFILQTGWFATLVVLIGNSILQHFLISAGLLLVVQT